MFRIYFYIYICVYACCQEIFHHLKHCRTPTMPTSTTTLYFIDTVIIRSVNTNGLFHLDHHLQAYCVWFQFIPFVHKICRDITSENMKNHSPTAVSMFASVFSLRREVNTFEMRASDRRKTQQHALTSLVVNCRFLKFQPKIITFNQRGFSLLLFSFVDHKTWWVFLLSFKSAPKIVKLDFLHRFRKKRIKKKTNWRRQRRPTKWFC